MYPKINHMGMYRHQYPIFHFDFSSTSKYLRHRKISISQIAAAVVTCS